MGIDKNESAVAFDHAQFLDAFDELVVFIDEQLVVFHANKAFLDKMNYSREELQGRSLEDFMPVNFKDAYKAQLDVIFTEEKKNTVLILELLHKNRKTERFKVSAALGHLPQQKLVLMLRCQSISDMLVEKENLDVLQSLYISIADQASESYFMHDKNGKLLDVNRRACEKLGYTRDELLNMSVHDIEIDNEADGSRQLWERIRPGESYKLKGRFRGKNGMVFSAEISFGCTIIGGDKIYFGLATDLSNVERVEKNYKTIVESAPDPIFIQTDYKFAYLNPAACKFFGIESPDALIGTPIVDRFEEEYRDIILGRIQTLNDDRQPVEAYREYKFLSKNGVVWGETSGVPYEYEGKSGALVFLRDVTARKKAEEALQNSENRYELIFNKSAGPMILTKLPEHSVVEVNDAWVSLYGYERSEVVGKTTLELGLTKQLITDKAVLAELSEHKIATNVETRAYTKSGEELTLLDNICIFEYNGDRFALISNQNITEIKRAADKLYESNERFRKSFEYSALPMCMTGIDGRLKAVNKMMCQLFGYTSIELEGKPVEEITHPDDCQVTREVIDRLISGRSNAETVEKRYIKKNGDHFYAMTSAALVRDIEGRAVHIITQIRDVTEVRTLLNELRASEAFSRTIMDNLPIGISVNSYKPPLAFSYMNDKFPEFYRTTREALGGVDVFFDAVYEEPTFREEIRRRILDDISSGDPARMRWENVPITRQGEETRYVTAYNTAVPERDLHISIVTDETERVKALQELQEKAIRLQAIHEFDLSILRGFDTPFSIGENVLKYIDELLCPDAIGIGILGLDDEVMHIVTCHNSGEATMQIDEPVSEWEVEQLSEMSELAACGFDGRPPALVRRLFRCKGMCNCFNIPIFTEGKLRGIINIGYTPPKRISEEHIEIIQEMATQVSLAIEQTRLRHVTELYATSLETMIGERTAELEEANRELESFTFSVSHDLRAPLRSLHGFVRILLEDYSPMLDEEGQRICGVIASSAQNMGQLIDDLLALSRVGRSSLELGPVDMRAMAERVYIEMTTPEQRETIDCTITELADACGDHRLLRQVWVNLIDNAIKFASKREKPRLYISSEKLEGEIVYSVRDNGAGFNMLYKDKLFGVFQRLHSQKDFSGTGVGLAIVSRIIRRHGGRVWAYGEENAGATFYFSLKREDESNAVRCD